MKEKKYYGKEKCRILKQIRAEIARQNDIAWVVEECAHKGNCRGTCPKCESEVRQLEKALERRAALGKTVAVAGIAAGLSLSVTGCLDMFQPTAGVPEPPPGGVPAYEETTETTQPASSDTVEETYTEMVEGEMIPIPGEEPDTETNTEQETSDWLMGEPVEEAPSEDEEIESFGEVEIMGDMVIED